MADSPQESLGKRLKRERERRGWTQDELAEKSRVSVSSIRRWENDRAKPRKKELALLVEAFGRPPELWGIATPLWNVPFPRNRYFTGREDILKSLHDALTSERTVALSQAISGLGGIGKTQTAIEYAYRYEHEYRAVLWVRADKETLVSDFAALAAILDLAAQHERDQSRVAEAVRRWLQTHGSWLLIFDNADDLALISRYLPGQGRGAVLLTTRAQATGPYIQQKIEMEEMSRKDGIDFLLHRKYGDKAQRPSADSQEREEVGQIWEQMKGLPLALDQAAAYLEETGCSFSDYLDMYKTHRKDLLTRRGGTTGDHPESVAATWLMALKKIERDRHAAAQLLRFCAFLHPDTIPESLFIKGKDALWPVLRRTASDTFAWNEAIAELHKYSLLKRDDKEKILRMHRLVQAVVKDDMPQKAAREWAERAVRVVDAAFPGPEPGFWPQCELLLPHALLAARHIEEYNILREEAGNLLYRMASYLQERARYAEAEPLYQRALSIREQMLGSEHPQVAIARSGLAELYRKQGTYELSEPLFLRALHIWEQQRGPEPAEVATALNGLGRLYYEQGRYELAEPLYSQAISIREYQLGTEHPQVAIALNGLGELYRKQGRYELAEPLFLRALHIWEQQRGPEPADMSAPINNLAALYYEQGRYELAEPLFLRAWQIWEKRLGPDHPQVAIALNNLAWLYRQQGKYEQAEALYQQARSIWEHHLGPEHYQVAYPLNNLAELYLEQGRYAEAEPLFLRALSIFEQRLGPDHSQVAYPLNGLAKLHHAQNEYELAEPLYQRAISVREHQLGPEHPQVAFPLNNLALLYAEQGNEEQAQALFQRALSIREQALGREHPETAETLHDYATFEEMRGNPQKARSLYQRTLIIREQILGPHHPKTTETRRRLIALLHAIGRDEDAAQLEADTPEA